MPSRYAGLDGFSIEEVAKKVEGDYGKIDILVHSLANGPEVQKPLLETSRAGSRLPIPKHCKGGGHWYSFPARGQSSTRVAHSVRPLASSELPLLSLSGYLAAASASSYSLVSLVSKFGPIMNPGGSVLSLTYIASEKVGVCGRLTPHSTPPSVPKHAFLR